LPKSFAKAIERDRFVEMLLDVAANLSRGIGLRIGAERPWPATQAGAKAGFLCLFGKREKRYIRAPRTPRRTRRPAIDAGGGDGEDELAVVPGVAPRDRVPAQVVLQPGVMWLGGAGCRLAGFLELACAAGIELVAG